MGKVTDALSNIGGKIGDFFESPLGSAVLATGTAALLANQTAKNQERLINAQNSGQAVTATDAQKQAQESQNQSQNNSGTGSNNTVIIVVAVVVVLAIGGFMVYKMKK
jgi:hypothetical protein